MRAPASRAKVMARWTVARDSSEPSVGTKICLNMVCLLAVFIALGRDVFDLMLRRKRASTQIPCRTENADRKALDTGL